MQVLVPRPHTPSGPAAGTGRAGLRAGIPWRDLDWPLLGSTMVLALLGLVLICSATGGPSLGSSIVVRQAVFLVLGATSMAVLALVDYRRLRQLVLTLYLSCIVLLLVVLSPLGTEVKGTKGWLRFAGFSLQPAELVKVGLIVTLAAVFSGRGPLGIRGRFLVALGAAGVVAALVLAQGEVGSVLVYAAITLGIMVAAGVPPRYLIGLALLGVAGATFVVQAGLLEGYQQDRLTTFLDLEHDVRGASYNQHQSVTAVGSGGVWGQGLFDGPQTQLRFVPEQETDFIFTVVGEELGFAGSLLVLGLFALVLVRIHAVARSAQDDFGALLCVGVLVMLAFQLFQNVGMNLGILPVTGIPLPLLSYGGSSLLTVLTSLGLTSSVAAQRYRGSPF